MTRHESTAGRAQLDFADERDVDRFIDTLGKFERGEIGPDQWRAFRLVHGTYSQRQDGDWSMLRVKIPQGVLSAAQLEAVAAVAARWSRGFAHLTTRQNFQFHFMRLHDIERAMADLAAVGMTTKEACGNSVRNVTAPPTAGVAGDEAFDVTPYAEALTRHLLRHPLSSTLPRKFKIAFSGGGRDHSFVAINDIGFTARLDGAARAFRVTVAGGTATLTRAGQELFAALPAGDILAVAEAVLRVFDARGDREHRHKNRMKFLVKQLGWDTFRALVLAELEAVRAGTPPRLPFDEQAPPVEAAPTTRSAAPTASELTALIGEDAMRGPGVVPRFLPTHGAFERWRRSNSAAQRQPGYHVVTVTVPLGDLSSGRMRAIARLAGAFGDGRVRTTVAQNLVLRWVPAEALEPLWRHLDAIGLGKSEPDSLADVTSCPGAESCKLAVTQSRGVADLVSQHFAEQPALLDALGPAAVRVSGCPNGCGLHHVAALGLQGGLRKVGGRAAPQYFVYAGGHGGEGWFGRVVAKVPARRAPLALERLARAYIAERQPDETAAAFFQRHTPSHWKALLADLEVLSENDASDADFVDLGESEAFAPAATEGECSA